MGRGILFKGRWATAAEAPARPPRPKRRFTIPFDFPQFVLGPLSIRAFNTLFYWKHIPRVQPRGSSTPNRRSIRSTCCGTGTGCTAGAG